MTPAKGRATPGPWSAKFGENDGYDCMTAAWTITGADKRQVAVVDYANWNADHFDSTRIPEADANAHLIAASPMLLEALREATFSLEWVVIHDGQIEHVERLRAAKAAIRAAEGE